MRMKKIWRCGNKNETNSQNTEKGYLRGIYKLKLKPK